MINVSRNMRLGGLLLANTSMLERYLSRLNQRISSQTTNLFSPLQGLHKNQDIRCFSSKKEPLIQKELRTASSSKNFNYGFPTPGPQSPTPQEVMDHLFFVSKTEWKRIREELEFDYVVIGTSFAGLAFVERALKNNPFTRILMLERGPFFLPEHFQNLPIPYKRTLGGLSETFPWTLSEKTRRGRYIQWQHGAVPFFGGRSIMWSSWCPRPTEAEMEGWPKHTIRAAQRYFEHAEKLLNVISANDLDKNDQLPTSNFRPIFGELQANLTCELEKNLKKIPSATRVMAAPLAVRSEDSSISFAKFSTPEPLLRLVGQQSIVASEGKGAPLLIATECVVQRILQQNGKATALETSRGVVALGKAKLILAAGALPATTLVLNSFPQLKKVGEGFTAHFISAIVARIPREDYSFADKIGELELAAIYLAGQDKKKGQYHVQITALSDRDPMKNMLTAARHMPDVVATATQEQLMQSKDYIVFVCAVLGETAANNKENWVRLNDDQDPTTNVTLQAIESSEDSLTWETMDEGTFQAIEKVLSPKGRESVEYWHVDPISGQGQWHKAQRPSREQIRVPGLVHEGSTMPIGEGDSGVVDLDYRLKGVENVHVTGTSLWPVSGSWNPTLTLVALAQDLSDKLTTSSPKEETISK